MAQNKPNTVLVGGGPNASSTISISGSGGSGGGILGYAGSNISTSVPASASWANSNIKSGLTVTGDATFDGEITWKGRDLGDLLSTIENRLAILVPDPEKLAHFEALNNAYEQYKILEALCQMPSNDSNG